MLPWCETLLFLLVAASAILGAALAFDPARLCGSWGLMIVALVLWPFAISQSDRALASVPLEYLPLLFLVFSSTLSALLRWGWDLNHMQRWPLLFAGAFLLYGVASLGWTWSRAGWLREFAMFSGYFLWFHAVSTALRRQGLERLLRLMEWLVYFSLAFALIGMLRVFLVPGRYVGDFSSLIEYRSSEVMVLFSATFMAFALYAVQGRASMLVVAVFLWSSMFLTFSRTGMVGHCLATAMLIALSWFCHGWPGQRVRHAAAILAVCGAVVVGLACVASPKTLAALVHRAGSIDLAFDIFGDDELQVRDDIGGRRATLFRLSLQLHELHPWMGVGMGGYRHGVEELTDDPYLWARSHNFYSSYLAELGWIGFAPLMAFALWFPLAAWGAMWRLRFGTLRILAAMVAATNVPILVMLMAQEFISAPYIWLHWTICAALLGATLDYQTQQAGSRGWVAARAAVSRPRPPAAVAWRGT